jgi:hypothetical protein
VAYIHYLGTRIGRVRVIFTIPDMLDTSLGPRQRPDTWHNGPLAFVEWYSPTPSSTQENHGLMYRIKKIKTSQGRSPGAIIPLNNIRQVCMLSPAFEREIPKTWRSDNILDLASIFFINNWSSKYAYQTIW